MRSKFSSLPLALSLSACGVEELGVRLVEIQLQPVPGAAARLSEVAVTAELTMVTGVAHADGIEKVGSVVAGPLPTLPVSWEFAVEVTIAAEERAGLESSADVEEQAEEGHTHGALRPEGLATPVHEISLDAQPTIDDEGYYTWDFEPNTVHGLAVGGLRGAKVLAVPSGSTTSRPGIELLVGSLEGLAPAESSGGHTHGS